MKRTTFNDIAEQADLKPLSLLGLAALAAIGVLAGLAFITFTVVTEVKLLIAYMPSGHLPVMLGVAAGIALATASIAKTMTETSKTAMTKTAGQQMTK
jgi:hypothetical protein